MATYLNCLQIWMACYILLISHSVILLLGLTTHNCDFWYMRPKLWYQLRVRNWFSKILSATWITYRVFSQQWLALSLGHQMYPFILLLLIVHFYFNLHPGCFCLAYSIILVFFLAINNTLHYYDHTHQQYWWRKVVDRTWWQVSCKETKW